MNKDSSSPERRSFLTRLNAGAPTLNGYDAADYAGLRPSRETTVDSLAKQGTCG